MQERNTLPKATRKDLVQVLNCMIGILLFIFTFYAFTAILAFLAYILWYILCTNATLSFVVTRKK